MSVRNRLTLAAFAVLACATTLYNWYLLGQEHRFYVRLAFFAPCFAVLFGTVSIRPGLAGPVSPSDNSKKYRQAALLLLGLAAGLINWYAMARS